MDGQVVHFEIPAQDGERAMAFWKSLFGWKFQAWEGQVEYHMLEGNEPGGAIYPDTDGAGSGPIVYFGTSDIDASIARARELGGSAGNGRLRRCPSLPCIAGRRLRISTGTDA